MRKKRVEWTLILNFIQQWKKFIIWASASFISLMLFYLFFLNYVEPTQIGIARNSITGQMWLQSGGWHVTNPWTRVARIDTRPMRIAVMSAGHGYHARLVRFVPQHWKTFVEIEGFRYYWWYNRFSFNGGHREEYRGMRDIMRGYGYSAKKYPFIEILSEYTEK